jgi:hypothetical protein
MRNRHLGARPEAKRNCRPSKGEGDFKGGAISWSRGITIAIGVVVAFSSVAAAQDVTYEVSGIQTGVAENFSSFAGVGSSDDGDVAVWEAEIERIDLTEITGGVLHLNGVLRELTGVFTGGTITALPGGKCRMEKFAVAGDLSLDGGGVGTFNVILTHYGTRIGGQCFLYFATVEGAVTFTNQQSS